MPRTPAPAPVGSPTRPRPPAARAALAAAGPGSRGTAARVVAAMLGALTVGALLTVVAPAAQAHNALRETSPAHGSTVPFAPDRVTLTFDAPATALGTELVVTAPDGAVVSAGPAELADATVSQPLTGSLPAGAYTVQWRVTSADGHPIEGTFGFVAEQGTVAGTNGAPPPAPEPSVPATTQPEPEMTTQSEPTSGDDSTPTPAPTDAPDDTAGMPVPVVVGIGVAAAAAGALLTWLLLRRRPTA